MDAYCGSGFHPFYDRKDRLEAVEKLEPAAPTLGKITMLGRKLATVAAALK
jgi:hypothetical protein